MAPLKHWRRGMAVEASSPYVKMSSHLRQPILGDFLAQCVADLNKSLPPGTNFTVHLSTADRAEIEAKKGSRRLNGRFRNFASGCNDWDGQCTIAYEAGQLSPERGDAPDGGGV